MAKKFYVVWRGRQPGIFTDWPSCQAQINKFPGARYKSFKTRAEAEAAYKGTAASTDDSDGPAGRKPGSQSSKSASKTYANSEIAAVPAEIKIFTDGGCDPNPGRAGSGMAVYQNEVLVELWYGLYNPAGTNNTAELNALHQAMLMARKALAEGTSVAIFCDSRYSIQCITQWAPGWQKKGWKRPGGGEIKNLELIKEMFTVYQSLENNVQILHVNGHVGIEGNELADRMSMLAIAKQEPEFVAYREALDVQNILRMRSG